MASIAITRGLFDPDYFWHSAIGRQILATGQIPRTDPFSFTWFGEPWVPDQWLGDVAIAWLNQTFGIGVSIALFAVAAAAAPVLVAEAARRQGAPLAMVAGMLVLVEATILPQATVRPQALGLTFVGALLAILIRARPPSFRWLFALPPMFLLWANVHGSFVIGLGIVGVYLLATLLRGTAMAPRRRLVAAVAAASLVATVINPSGPGGLAYALSFADPTDLGALRILEWQSPDFHGVQFVPFLGVLGAFLLADIRRAPWWMVVVALVGAAGGLYALRGVGIGAVMVMPAVLVANAVPGRVADRRDPARRRLEWVAAAVVAVAVVAVAVARGPIQSDPSRLPVDGTEALHELRPDANVLTRYEWGGYVLHELHPVGAHVFVDGRMHKYAPDVLAAYLEIIDAEPGWEELMESYGVEAILVSADTRVAMGPAQAEGWCEAYRDEFQVLLLRECA
jgi:hypothetical protein